MVKTCDLFNSHRTIQRFVDCWNGVKLHQNTAGWLARSKKDAVCYWPVACRLICCLTSCNRKSVNNIIAILLLTYSFHQALKYM